MAQIQLKIGIGPGSICTTRIVASELEFLNYMLFQRHTESPKKNKIPIENTDGGIKFSGEYC